MQGTTITRRRLLAVTAGTALGGTALLTTQTDAAAAAVEMGGFTLDDSEHIVDTVESVTISVPIDYSWQSPNGVDTVRLVLLIGDSLQNLEAVAVEDIAISTSEGEGSHTFEGVDITSTWHFSLSSFEPGEESVDNLVAAGVRMELLYNDEVVKEAYDDSAATVTTHPSGSLSMAFNSTGTIEVA